MNSHTHIMTEAETISAQILKTHRLTELLYFDLTQHEDQVDLRLIQCGEYLYSQSQKLLQLAADGLLESAA